jgi:hypothetical protein
MLQIGCARKQLLAFINEIARVKDSEFPYSHPKAALLAIENALRNVLSSIDAIDSTFDEKVVRNLGNQTIRQIIYYLPVVGYILRSTNARNAFEIHGPLLRLSRLLLGADTKLVVSSEWDWSPFTYIGVFHLPEFVFIGLPAYESANPFLLPLSGHELGHSLWEKLWGDATYAAQETQRIELAVKEACLKSKSNLFKRQFGNQRPDDLTVWPFISQCIERAIQQSMEVFCDCIGLRLFAEAYLFATAYFLSNSPGEVRSLGYPKIGRRVEHLTAAAGAYGINVPTEYSTLFEDEKEPTEPWQELLAALADEGSRAVAADMISKADEVLSNLSAPKRSLQIVDKLVDRLMFVIPCENGESLTNVINAGWKALNDPKFSNHWATTLQINPKYADDLLAELILKSIEVLEIEQRTK